MRPEEVTDLGSLMGFVLEQHRQSIDDCLPAVVLAYDADSNRASVQPLHIITSRDGEIREMQPIASVPVLRYGAGGFVICPPIKPGDHGWLKACDQDISLSLESLSKQPGNTSRSHSFSDSFFIPDILVSCTPKNAEALCLQSVDGATAIVLNQDKITLTAGGVTLAIGDGRITSTHPISAPQIQTDAGVKLGDHRHGGVDSGNSKTGGPE